MTEKLKPVTLPRTQLVLPRGPRRIDRIARMVRAAWRDTLALWSEFRAPILVFLTVVLIGGSLYGFLNNNVAGNQPIAAANLPYIIISLMLLQTPLDLPSQPYLMVFWYLLPLIAVYIIGRGTVDFVRLFFDRSERRSAWEEAVASTYRNHVIVLGVGHVGLRVVRTLAAMGFEVVGIDQQVKPELDDELKRLGVPMIGSDGRLATTLETAGLRHAQALVVCTASDQVNLEVTMRARDMNPDVRIVVRMWDNQFAHQLQRFMNVHAVLSASDLAAPAFAGAAVGVEIAQSLNVHGVEYSMIRLQVEAGSFMDGQAIGKLQDDYGMDIVLYGHGEEVEVHPHHEIEVQAGDTLVIFARHSQITEIVMRKRGKRS